MDRAFDYGSKGSGFESLPVRNGGERPKWPLTCVFGHRREPAAAIHETDPSQRTQVLTQVFRTADFDARAVQPNAFQVQRLVTRSSASELGDNSGEAEEVDH
jgi:hypothetical protein